MKDQTVVDSIAVNLEAFLKSQARKRKYVLYPLTFRIEQKPVFKIIDSNKLSALVNETDLQSFKDIYSDPKYKYIKVFNWEFDVDFDGKICKKITLASDRLLLFDSKGNQKGIYECCFKAVVYENEAIASLNKETQGYLNRIGKKNIIKNSEHIINEYYSLISFVPQRKPVKLQKIIVEAETQTQKEEDPIAYLSSAGLKVAEKLKSFISRRQIFDFMVKQQISEEGERRLRKIILPTVEEKKKPASKK